MDDDDLLHHLIVTKAEIGYGWFRLSPRKLPWFIRPASLHDLWYELILSGKSEMSFDEADRRFYRLVELEILNPSVTELRHRRFARMTLALAKHVVIPAFRKIKGRN